MSRPDFLHQSLQLDFDITDLDGTQGGWLLEAVSSAYIELASLLPAEIRRSVSEIWPTDYDGEGVTFRWTPNACCGHLVLLGNAVGAHGR